MVTDKELFVQIIERDIENLYRNLAKKNSILNIPLVQDRLSSYADTGVEYLTKLLFGEDDKATADEASEMAKLVAEDKINHYRDKLKNKKAEMNKTEHDILNHIHNNF